MRPTAGGPGALQKPTILQFVLHITLETSEVGASIGEHQFGWAEWANASEAKPEGPKDTKPERKLMVMRWFWTPS